TMTVPCPASPADWRNPSSSVNTTPVVANGGARALSWNGTPRRPSGSQTANGFMPASAATSTSCTANPRTAMGNTSRNSLTASALIIGFFSGKGRQRPPWAAGVFDERVFQVEVHDVDAPRAQGLQRCPLLRTEVDED